MSEIAEQDDYDPLDGPPDAPYDASLDDAIARHYAREQEGLPPPLPQDPDWVRKWAAHMHGTTYRPREADPPPEREAPVGVLGEPPVDVSEALRHLRGRWAQKAGASGPPAGGRGGSRLCAWYVVGPGQEVDEVLGRRRQLAWVVPQLGDDVAV